MTIDTISLQCFIAAAETGSFTKAAGRVGRTQSAVSQQVAKLEDLLGKKLFKRTKILELTSEGEIFLNYAKQIFGLHRETIDYFKEPDLKGEVRFGIPDDFASVFLYEVLSEFTSLHPNISLHIECDLTMNLYENFKKKKLDLVLLKMPCPKDAEFGVELSLEKLCWVGNQKLIRACLQNNCLDLQANLGESQAKISKKYRDTSSKFCEDSRLKESQSDTNSQAANLSLKTGSKNQKTLPLALSPKPCVYRKAAIEALESKKMKWRIAFSSHSYSGLIAALRAGLGITVLPQKMIPKDLRVLKSESLPTLGSNHISLIKSTNQNPAINSFEGFIIKHIG